MEPGRPAAEATWLYRGSRHRRGLGSQRSIQDEVVGTPQLLFPRGPHIGEQRLSPTHWASSHVSTESRLAVHVSSLQRDTTRGPETTKHTQGGRISTSTKLSSHAARSLESSGAGPRELVAQGAEGGGGGHTGSWHRREDRSCPAFQAQGPHPAEPEGLNTPALIPVSSECRRAWFYHGCVCSG